MADSEPVFSSIRSQSLASRIVSQVIAALFAGQFKPGEFLGTEAQLAETFQTSRVPIREALGRLEALGVITVKTGVGGGATIAEGKPDQFATALAVQFMLIQVTAEEVFDARLGIECRAAELAAERIDDAQLAALKAALDRIMEPDISRPEAVERILAFHRAIVEASGARTLVTLMHALEHALLNLFTAIEASPKSSRIGYKALQGIYDRIAAHDPEGAFTAMRAHLLDRRQSMLYRLKQMSDQARAAADAAPKG